MQWITRAATILAVMAISPAVMAQTSPPTPGMTQSGTPPASPGSDRMAQSRYQAPPGHRQPKPSDLPPAVTHDEDTGATTGNPPAIDRRLQICRGC